MISGDHERTAIDFQKHYRLPMVHLMDTDLSLQGVYNHDGWPFLMVVDPNGDVVHKANNLVDNEARILQLLETLKAAPDAAPIRTVNGTDYSAETLRRSGELDKPRVQERCSCLAAGTDGRMFLVSTSTHGSASDVYLRTWAGGVWSADRPVAASQADEYDATVVVSPANQAWFCWTSNAGSGQYNIFVTSLDKLEAGEAPIQVTQSDDDAMYGRLASSANGDVWITYYRWQKNRQGISRDKEIFVRRLKDGALSREVQVSPTDVPSYEDHTDPAVAIVSNRTLVCWSWDFHQPKGYTRDAESPTIFVSAIGDDLKPSRPFHVSGRNIDMVPTLAAQGSAAWCAWDSLVHARGRTSKSLCVRRVDAGQCQGEVIVIASGLEHICSPCFATGPGDRTTLIWCQKQRDKPWELRRSDCDDLGRWSEGRPLVTQGNPRYCSAAFDTQGGLWVSYTADTEQGRQVRTVHPE